MFLGGSPTQHIGSGEVGKETAPWSHSSCHRGSKPPHRPQSHQAPARGAPGGAEPKAQMQGWHSRPLGLSA